MRVFVLTAGRSGSMTFYRACQHVTNYSTGHEDVKFRSLMEYPDNHIEVDGMLCFMLGTLDARYGNSPVYVHLKREPERVATSWARRMPDAESWPRWLRIQLGLTAKPRSRQTRAVWIGHHLYGGAGRLSYEERMSAARKYVDRANDNIRHFLKDKSKVVDIEIEQPDQSFRELWEIAGFDGSLDGALEELGTVYNASK